MLMRLLCFRAAFHAISLSHCPPHFWLAIAIAEAPLIFAAAQRRSFISYTISFLRLY